MKYISKIRIWVTIENTSSSSVLTVWQLWKKCSGVISFGMLGVQRCDLELASQDTESKNLEGIKNIQIENTVN